MSAPRAKRFDAEAHRALNALRRQLKATMRDDGVSQRELAARIDVSEGLISMQLRFGNFTIATVARFAAALDRDLVIELRKRT
jgi:transcriptional regulator with XRE-family HTH domain